MRLRVRKGVGTHKTHNDAQRVLVSADGYVHNVKHLYES
jgi:hypothetical protein